jgi:hypothetical protein
MSIPTGYERLAVIGIAWKDEYNPGTAYKTMNGVYYKGSTYVALRDNPTGPPAADGANWQYLAKGFEQQLLSAITALDTSGVLGQAGASVGGQALMDAIADKVMTKLVERSSIVQTESTDPTTVPSSPYFKKVTDKLTSDLGNIGTNLSDVSTELAATNTDLDPLKSNRVSHINSNVLNKVNIVLWDADTADTPFKAGNTNRGNGFCITYSSGEPYSCQLAMAVGDSHLFTRNSSPDGWSGWTTK